jgi:hypothetical protein
LLCVLLLKVRLKFVLEVFLAEQIESVPGHPSKHRVHHPGSKLAIGRVENWAKNSHQENQSPATEAPSKCLSIPGKESHRPDHRQIEKTPLHPPVDRGTGIVV